MIHKHGRHLIDIFMLRNQLGNVKIVGQTASRCPKPAGLKGACTGLLIVTTRAQRQMPMVRTYRLSEVFARRCRRSDEIDTVLLPSGVHALVWCIRPDGPECSNANEPVSHDGDDRELDIPIPDRGLGGGCRPNTNLLQKDSNQCGRVAHKGHIKHQAGAT